MPNNLPLGSFCPTCQSCIHVPGAEYCSQDGARLVERKTHSCGQVLLPLDKYCPKCGKNLQVEARGPAMHTHDRDGVLIQGGPITTAEACRNGIKV